MHNTKPTVRAIRGLQGAQPANEVSRESMVPIEIAALRPKLHQVAMSLTRDAALADDLVQDAMEKAFAKRGRFEAEPRLLAWAKMVMRNALFDRFRHERLHAPLEFDVAGQEEEICFGPADVLTTDDVVSAVAFLRPRDREVVQLALLDGRSYREMSAWFGVGTNTVGVRLKRARERLRGILAKTVKERLRLPQAVVAR